MPPKMFRRVLYVAPKILQPKRNPCMLVSVGACVSLSDCVCVWEPQTLIWNLMMLSFLGSVMQREFIDFNSQLDEIEVLEERWIKTQKYFENK